MYSLACKDNPFLCTTLGNYEKNRQNEEIRRVIQIGFPECFLVVTDRRELDLREIERRQGRTPGGKKMPN